MHPRCNYVFGPNGAGKTTLLEGIFLLGRGRSFRTRQLRRLVQHGADELAVFGELRSGERRVRLGVSLKDGRLEKRIDGDETAGMVALAQVLPVHVVDPSIHALIEGAPGERRRFLDWGVFHVEHAYLESWKRYRRLLGQRNAALKAGASPRELAAWTDPLGEVGGRVDEWRRSYVATVSREVKRLTEALLDEAVTIDYQSGWPASEALFVDALRVAEPRDRAAGTTEVGPHRADLVFRIGGRRVQNEASRGQQKLIAAALVLAQAAVASAVSNEGGVVLVDDPAAELDATSLERLLKVLDTTPGQLLLTGLTPGHLPTQADSARFHVERGVVREL